MKTPSDPHGLPGTLCYVEWVGPCGPAPAGTMYADAHCDPAAPVAGMPPELGGFEARDCWADMYGQRLGAAVRSGVL